MKKYMCLVAILQRKQSQPNLTQVYALNVNSDKNNKLNKKNKNEWFALNQKQWQLPILTLHNFGFTFWVCFFHLCICLCACVCALYVLWHKK